LYLLFTPALALLVARFFERWASSEVVFSEADFKWLAGLVILQTALYPYGIFKTNVVHDALTSVELSLTALGFLWIAKRRSNSVSKNTVATFLALAFFGNLSQMMNYRNEPDTERSFCEWAKTEYARTGQPIHTKEHYSRAKFYLYCRNIPIVYEGDENPQ
jgi:hypothetical protein